MVVVSRALVAKVVEVEQVLRSVFRAGARLPLLLPLVHLLLQLLKIVIRPTQAIVAQAIGRVSGDVLIAEAAFTGFDLVVACGIVVVVTGASLLLDGAVRASAASLSLVHGVDPAAVILPIPTTTILLALPLVLRPGATLLEVALHCLLNGAGVDGGVQICLILIVPLLHALDADADDDQEDGDADPEVHRDHQLRSLHFSLAARRVLGTATVGVEGIHLKNDWVQYFSLVRGGCSLEQMI